MDIKQRRFCMHCHRSRVFVPLFYFVLVISVLASSRLDAASLQLSWVDNSDNEDGFHIERKVGTNGIFSFVAAVGPNTTSYTDDNLASNTTYCYRLNAFNDVGISAYTNEACGTTSGGASAPPTPPVPSSNTVVTNITDGAVLSGSSVIWTATPSGSPVRVEFFIDGTLSWTENASPYQFNGDPSGTLNTNTLSDGSHQLGVRAVYSNNSTAEQTVTVIVSNGASLQISSTIAATLLGQTGEDIAGTTSETPDGIPDVHIRLSGVQGTITQVRIMDGGSGIWETPYNDWWIVAIRPHSDPSLVDLYFDFWEPTSSYAVTVTLANGTTQTVQTSASLSLQMLGNSP